ncbi:hypothetical protein JOC86_002590 [Bacillus pakistanensis]|uniref:Uncharacterized protein n=1 Tax=Rossellomorea pakistanensis TaxID=992288 RepID=A0ABS2NDW5_9BACI|nr:hypothetical protein [Bacillus pakistanensis]
MKRLYLRDLNVNVISLLQINNELFTGNITEAFFGTQF